MVPWVTFCKTHCKLKSARARRSASRASSGSIEIAVAALARRSAARRTRSCSSPSRPASAPSVRTAPRTLRLTRTSSSSPGALDELVLKIRAPQCAGTRPCSCRRTATPQAERGVPNSGDRSVERFVRTRFGLIRDIPLPRLGAQDRRVSALRQEGPQNSLQSTFRAIC